VGKSRLGLELALRYGGEIVSADSMQVYRGLDIGTAKPTPVERAAVVHHLVDVADLGEQFSVARYQRLAGEAIAAIRRAGKLPLVVGGTMLYLRAVVDGYVFAPSPPDPALRRELTALAETLGAPGLHQRLQAVDPNRAARIHPHDRKRILRALEVYHTTGRPLSAQEGTHPVGRGAVVMVGLTRPRPELYRAIDARVDAMLAAGLLGEVESLVRAGHGPDLQRLGALGYRELTDYLRGLGTLPEAVRLVKRNTRRLAKRQLTWLRADPRINWLHVGENRQLKEIVADASRLLQENMERA
jgi:tRNA dimethylallyltransferase